MYNPYFKLAQSTIPGAGKGAFAIRDIPKGTRIVQYKGKLISKELSDKIAEKHKKKGELWIFTLNDAYDIDGSRGGNEARFINNDTKNPNCEATNYDDEEVWIEAKRDIKKGEELFYDYGFDEEDEDYPWYVMPKDNEEKSTKESSKEDKDKSEEE